MKKQTDQEFVDEFEWLAYMGYLSACIGWGDLAPVDQDEYTRRMREEAPLLPSDFQKGISSDWAPEAKDLKRYNHIIQMTRLGELLTGLDEDE